MHRFVLYSLSRCGTTTIAEVINAVAPGSCVLEPFNKDVHGDKYLSIALCSGIAPALRDIYDREGFHGIKHVCHPTGWPFPDASKLNDELLSSRDCRVVLLYRKNLLKRIVSQLIAEQSRMWTVDNQVKQQARNKCRFKELDHRQVEWFLLKDKMFLPGARSKLGKAGKLWMEMEFEEIFGVADPLASMRAINTILSFIDAPCVESEGPLPACIDQLIVKRADYTSLDIYQVIPGIGEIDRLFGSEDNGYLSRS